MSDRRTIALIAACAALLVCALVAAPGADAAKLWACVRPSGKLRVFVLHKPRCGPGSKTISWNTHGPAGEPGSAGLDGSDGLDGDDGLDGSDGADGTDGKDGAVAGFSAAQKAGEELLLGSSAKTVLSKELPEGSFIVSANVELDALAKGTGDAGVSCTLLDAADAEGTDPNASATGRWLAAIDVPVPSSPGVDGADGEIPLSLAVSPDSDSTLSLRCRTTAEGGSEVAISASDAALVALQTSSNS